MSIVTSLYRAAVVALVRPITRRELPGWGILYRRLVGSFENDRLWQGLPERWVRGKLHGYEMSLRIGGWSNRHTFFLERFYDLPTQLLLKDVLRDGDTFVDVGANEGMMTLLGAHLVGPGGQVVAFEPNPLPRAILKRNLARNGIPNVELHAAGLGEHPADMALFVPDINSGEGSFTEPAGEAAGTYVECPVMVGDDALAGRHPRMIKIDVEGFEMRVLAGLSATIAAAKPMVVVEVVERHLRRDGQSPAAVFAWFADRGYRGERLGLTRGKRLERGPIPHPWRDGDYVFMHPDNPA
jgi:FkbM family methyltransferase